MTTLAFAALLVLYGNGAAFLAGSALPKLGWLGASLGAILVVATLAWARWQKLGCAEMGLGRDRALSSAGVGLLVAVALVLPSLLVLRFPPLLGQPVTYAPLASLALGDLAVRVAFFMPLDTVIPEELAFRGVLLAALRRRFATVAAVALSALAFTAWHVVIVQATLAETNLVREPLFAALGYGGAFAAVFGGGVLFAALRLWTRNLAAPLAGHWVFNAALLAGLTALD